MMKATGIVRRIDDLGRVVIPKEIRRTMHIRESDPLEIFTNKEGEVIFKKYSPLGEISDFATIYTQTLSKNCGIGVLISDNDIIISSSGIPKKDFHEKQINNKVIKIIQSRNSYCYKAGDVAKISVLEEDFEYYASIIVPLIANGDIIGSVITILPATGAVTSESDLKIITTTSELLSKQLEE